MNFNSIKRMSSDVTIGSSRSLASVSSQPQVETAKQTTKPGMFRSQSVGTLDLVGQQSTLLESIETSSPRSLQQTHSALLQQTQSGVLDDTPLPKTGPSGVHDLSSIITSRFTGIEKGLRGIFKSKSHFFKGLQSNKSLKQEAFNKAKSMMKTEVAKVKNGQHSDLIFNLTTKTKAEVRNDVVKSVLGMRDSKYGPLVRQAEQEFQPRIQAYEKHQALVNEFRDIKTQLGELNNVPVGPQRDEEWQKLVVPLKSRIMEIYAEIPTKKDFVPFMSDTTMVPDINSIVKPVKPELDLYAVLSDNKKGLVDNIIAGFESVQMPNHIDHENDMGMIGGLETPTKITLGDKTIHVNQHLTTGGGGHLFKASDESGKEYVVKISNKFGELGWNELLIEVDAHYKANMVGSNNIMGLSGIVKTQDPMGDEMLVMVMDLADGGDMHGLIHDKLTHLNLSEETNDLILLQNMQDAAVGLAAMHTTGMIHLDVKDLNMFMMGDGRAVLADFGEVKKGPFKEIAGTEGYMPPEVYDSEKEADQKVDVFSYGMMMYELFIGDNPFKQPDRLNPNDKIVVPQRMIDYGSNPDNRLINKDNLSPIEDLINQATHPDPEQRPTMQEILNHPAFQNPKLGSDNLRTLIGAVVTGQHDNLQQLEEQL